MKDPNDKNKLVIDEEAAAVVRQIFRWASEGHREQSITAMLNERGIPNPTRYKELHGSSYRNGTALHHHGLWSKPSVKRILRNEMYTGTMVQGRTKKVSYKSKKVVSVPEENWYVVPGTHEAIIDRETFERVQPARELRTREDKRGELHPLAGLVRCMECGSAMSKTSNNNHTYYLRCKLSMASGSRKLCTRHSIRLDKLVSLVEQRLREYISTFYEVGDVTRFKVKPQGDSESATVKKELAAVESSLEKRAAALKALYLDKVSGIIDEAQFCEMNHSFLEEKKRLERQRAELLQRAQALASPEADGERDTLEKVRCILESGTATRELMLLAVERVEVGERDPETKRQEVKIHWRF